MSHFSQKGAACALAFFLCGSAQAGFISADDANEAGGSAQSAAVRPPLLLFVKTGAPVVRPQEDVRPAYDPPIPKRAPRYAILADRTSTIAGIFSCEGLEVASKHFLAQQFHASDFLDQSYFYRQRQELEKARTALDCPRITL